MYLESAEHNLSSSRFDVAAVEVEISVDCAREVLKLAERYWRSLDR